MMLHLVFSSHMTDVCLSGGIGLRDRDAAQDAAVQSEMLRLQKERQKVSKLKAELEEAMGRVREEKEAHRLRKVFGHAHTLHRRSSPRTCLYCR